MKNKENNLINAENGKQIHISTVELLIAEKLLQKRILSLLS